MSRFDTLLDGRGQTVAIHLAGEMCDLHCVPRTDERTRVELADLDGPPNRTMQTLARAGLICSRRRVRIAARQAATELAEFDPTYLLLPI